jgi:hypothetical protein
MSIFQAFKTLDNPWLQDEFLDPETQAADQE